jgi:hypothetical protein
VDGLYTANYLFMALLLGGILFNFVRRSEFSIFILYAEMFTYFGAFLYPALIYSGTLSPAIEGAGFLATTGVPGIVTFFHIACYLIGAICGFDLADRLTSNRNVSDAFFFARTAIRNEIKFFKGALILGVGFLLLYLTLIGWSDAIAYAESMRNGHFGMISERAQRFLFLKSLAFTFTFIVCFIPYLLKFSNSRFYVSVYFLFTIMLYAVSLSRMVILLNLAVPLLVYLRIRSKNISTFIFLIAFASPLLITFLFYGKPLGYVLFKLITDGEIVGIEPYLSEHGLLSAFFGNFGFIWYSIEAGMVHIFSTWSPLIPTDLFLSMFGFIPSRILDYAGLSFIDYRMVEQPLACLNSQYFGLACTVPPRDLGLTAYILPFGGAFILGLVKYFIYRRYERYFIYFSKIDYAKTWYPILVIILATMFFSFIPTVLSQLIFLIGMLFFWFMSSLLLRAMTAAKSMSTQNKGTNIP